MKKTEHGNINPLIIFLIIIAAAIPLTVIVSQKQQEIRQRAAGNEYSCRIDFYRSLNGCAGDITDTKVVESSTDQSTNGCNPDTKAAILCTPLNISVPTNPPVIATSIPTQPSEPTASPIPPTSNPRCVQKYGDDCGANLEGYIACDGRCIIPPSPTSTPIINLTNPSTSPTIIPTQTSVSTSPTLILATCPYHGRGDANCDNKINLLDYMAWLNKSLGFSIDASFNPDFDNSGTIDKTDYQIVLNGILDPTLPH